jgi:glycosyltransferase involved in cell wall biosynthesis
MTSVGPRLRVIGVSPSDVSDWREPAPAGKWSQFYGALSQRLTVADVIRPQLPALREYRFFAKAFRPSRARWVAALELNVARRRDLNAELERELAARAGSYDLILQLQTLCTPRSRSVGAPYALYTDNTMALTQRLFPGYAPVPRAAIRDWLEFEARVCSEAEIVFTFSEFARASMVDDYGCLSERVVAVGAGANQLAATVPDGARRLPRALFVGNEFERKGGEVLLGAWTLVRERVPDAELIVAGPRRRGPSSLPEGVTWVGRLDRSQLDRQYRAASAFVLPSRFEAWGHVFVEAMGYGLPCIGSDCCAMPEIIEDGVTGLLVEPGEREPLAAALVELLRDPQKAAEMGRAGHAKVLASLTWGHVADRVVSRLG